MLFSLWKLHHVLWFYQQDSVQLHKEGTVVFTYGSQVFSITIVLGEDFLRISLPSSLTKEAIYPIGYIIPWPSEASLRFTFVLNQRGEENKIGEAYEVSYLKRIS